MLGRVTLALLALAVLTLFISNGVNSQVCPEGMVAYWKFDEGDGTTASDSFDANHGTIYGSTWRIGQVGGALSFDDVNDYVEGEYTAESSPRIGTVEVWVNAYSYPTRYRYGIIAVGAVERDRCSLSDIVELDWDGKISYDLWGECKGPLYRPVSATVLNLNEWYHVAVTLDGIDAKIYINGTFETSISSPYGCSSPMYKFIFSKISICWSSFYSHDAFHGAIDELAMYDRALTPGEIQQHYENGLNGLGYCEQAPLAVNIDIKPGSDPNCFNNDGHGVIPVAILGSAALDVTQIDASTVQLESIAVKAVGKSNRLLAHTEDVNEDGFDDLVVQIEDSDRVFSPGDTTATVTGSLVDGTGFEGTDTICIVGSSLAPPRLNTRPKLTATWGRIKSQ
ncbi:LamG domain-containing protein [Candidatus Poribacteria bacterium]